MSVALATVTVTVLALALHPVLQGLANLAVLRRPPLAPDPAPDPGPRRVSILIPARDEEAVIGRAVASALAGRDVVTEVVVMDDQSRDETARIVREIAATDPRVRLETAPPLAPGWCGKQHACQALADTARGDVLLFVDADVELAPDAPSRIARFLDDSGAALVSGVPRQVTGTLAERLLIPLIHFVLLGYLPISAMRRSRNPAFAAGCGQLFAARRDAYRQAGGHAAIRASRHDGLTLPRAFRRAGLATDLFDATPVARCRMYQGAREVVPGLAKNATEGMAGPRALPVWTLLLGGGQVLPPILALGGWLAGAPAVFVGAMAAAAGAACSLRLLFALRFDQPVLGALLHPVGVAWLLGIQVWARVRELRAEPIPWKGRVEA